MKILVPTDFSRLSDTAVEYAAKMAKKIKAELILLNIVYINTHPKVSTALKTDEIEDAMAERAGKVFDIMIKQLRSNFKGLKISSEIIKGFPVEDYVEKAAKRFKADLIVMGTKGASGLKKIFFGSNAVSVIGKSSIPVITVPEHALFHPIKNLVYASDLNKTEKELKTLLPLAKIFHSDIHVVHINTDSDIKKIDTEKVRKSLVKKLRYPKISVDELSNGSISQSLDEFVTGTKGDLLAMFTQKRSFFEKLLDKSVTNEIAYHSWIPLLTFKK